ncbi:MAG TPA: hypothetical protein VMB05_05745, partial [Solirubrobacteraceae bacterium]|nr:hypothetical protein [Solirubrobacteraceae bacterium]
ALTTHGGRMSGEDMRPAPPSVHDQVLYRAPAPAPGRSGAVLIDEQEASSRPPSSRSPRTQPQPPAHDPPEREPVASAAHSEIPSRGEPRPLPWEIPLTPAVSSTGAEHDPRTPVHRGAHGEDTVLRVSRGPVVSDDDRVR